MKRLTCPICGTEYTGYPALSRKDNVTEICPDCGVREALDAYVAYVEDKNAEKMLAISHENTIKLK